MKTIDDLNVDMLRERIKYRAREEEYAAAELEIARDDRRSLVLLAAVVLFTVALVFLVVWL